MIAERHLAAAAMEIAGGVPAELWATARTIALCDALGQYAPVLGDDGEQVGFIAWFRVDHEHLGIFEQRDWSALLALPARELIDGPVLFIAEMAVVEPGAGAAAARELMALPGVTHCACFRRGRFRFKRVRGRVEEQ